MTRCVCRGQVVYAERKQREIELAKMKKEAEEKKMQHERIERRIVSTLVVYWHVQPLYSRVMLEYYTLKRC